MSGCSEFIVILDQLFMTINLRTKQAIAFLLIASLFTLSLTSILYLVPESYDHFVVGAVSIISCAIVAFLYTGNLLVSIAQGELD